MLHDVYPGTHRVGLRVDRSPDTRLTELRAAYLIAFVALGNRWALSPALDEIRDAIRAGDVSAGGRVRTFVVNTPSVELANSILVDDEADIIAVVGDDPRYGLVLPL